MSAPAAQLRTRNLRTLALLAGLFLLPLLASFWMYYATDWRPASHVNHGELITPARPLPRVELPRALGDIPVANLFVKHWTLVYVGSGRCDSVCRNTLYVIRQTRLSLNNEMTRVDRVFLATADCCDRDFLSREHAGLEVLDASGPAAAPLLQEFPAANRELSVFIVDPLGNLMMSFDSRRNPKGLLQDLQKLLKLSHIG